MSEFAALPTARPVDVLLGAIAAGRESLASKDAALALLADGVTRGVIPVEEGLQMLADITEGER